MNIQREELNFILQHANLKSLKELYTRIKEKHKVTVLQAPTTQTLLQPVYDPISEGKFYAGEILVTTTIVSVGDSANKGWAMVEDENEKLSLYISVCDGAYGADIMTYEINSLTKQTMINMKIEQQQLNQKVNATKVEFDLKTQG